MPSIKLKGQDTLLRVLSADPNFNQNISDAISISLFQISFFWQGVFEVLVLLFYLSVFWYFQSFLLLTVRCFLFIHLFNFGINLLAAPSLV